MLKNKVLIVAYHVESRRVASSAVFFYFKHTLLIELNDIKLSLWTQFDIIGRPYITYSQPFRKVEMIIM